MKLNIILLIVVTIFFSTSCGLKKGYLKFDKKNEDLVATQKIREFISKNPHPSIVLRVPNTGKDALQSDQNLYIYSAIEKELVKAGFNLKDRGLFNQVVNSQDALDYSKINDLTGTDLILELVKIDAAIPFSTNKAYTKAGKQKITKEFDYTRYGSSIEFKLIIVKNNDYGGSFSFYDTPCIENEYLTNCQCQVGYKHKGKFYSDDDVDFCDADAKRNKKQKEIGYQTNPQDKRIEKLARDGVKKLIDEIYSK